MPHNKNWEKYFINLEYKHSPTPMQSKALECLAKLNLFHDLKEFCPVFAGTIPLDIDIQGSDIDIICQVTDFARFQTRLRECFEAYQNFIITESYGSNSRHSISQFDAHTFRIEIYGEQKPVTEQNGFLHLVAEAKLLEIGGPSSKDEIRKIKNQGHKTEPAFAEFFKINGNAYTELVKLAPMTIDEIKKAISW